MSELIANDGVDVDISQRKRYEQELQSQKLTLEVLIENMDQGITLFDPDLRVVVANKKAARMMGLPPDFLKPGVSLADIVRYQYEHDEFENPCETLDEEIERRLQFSRKSRETYRYQRKRPDGTFLEVCNIGLPDGGWIVNETDISRAKEAKLVRGENEKRLIELNQHQKLAANIVSLGVCDFHLKSNAISWDDRLCKIYGLPPDEELTYEKMMSFIHPEDVDRCKREIAKMFEVGEVDGVEFRIVRPCGAIRHISTSGQILFDEDNEPVRFVGVNSDITERKLAEIERDRINMLKDEFISSVSHELRTPLTAIRGSLELMRANVTGEMPPAAIEMLDIALNNTDRLLLLINEILNLQKLESDTYRLRLQKFPIMAFLKQALSDLSGLEKEYGVKFVLKQSADIGRFCADKDRLMQVMGNLLSNASKFSPKGSIVEVNASLVGHKSVRVSVSDSGSGIPDEFKGDIFNRFTRFEKSDKRNIGGTGLGLAISMSIIQYHGGLLSFDSEPGVGSTFYFELPALENTAAYTGEDRRRSGGLVDRRNSIGSDLSNPGYFQPETDSDVATTGNSDSTAS